MQPEVPGRHDIEHLLSEHGVRVGIPLLFSDEVRRGIGIYIIRIPETPYVCHVRELRIRQEGEDVLTVENAMVMVGHGVAYGYDRDDWVFRGTGRSVNDTLSAYERAASLFKLPALDALIVCRADPPYPRPAVAERLTRSDIPYIIPDAPVHVGDVNDRWSGWAWPGQGIKLLVADARVWTGIGQWQRYWQQFGDYRATRQIPGMFKLHRVAGDGFEDG